ncbi:putrescine aminopropyltransferase [Ascosphaera acerosa]|nr:putrescine aminopropyltransferase [Ascosphaera acerosa]
MAGELTHPTIKDGWFSEVSDMWPGQAMNLRVKEILHHEKSKFQDVLVFESTDYGTVLVLDNVIQCTERDEFSYQEMITHLAMMSHPNPKRVLVVGGGDGGVLREVVKHDCVEKAVLVDIDEAVPRVSKQYLPGMAVGFDHPKVSVTIGDGFEYLKNHKNEFDVIITDSSDPEGPAEALFKKPYFDLLYEALTPQGIVTTQGENMWLHMPLIARLRHDMRQTFPVAEYAHTTIPTYPSGGIGFMVASKDASAKLSEPLRSWDDAQEQRLCRYYNKDVHRASFVLPGFAKKVLATPIEQLDQLEKGQVQGKML